jgi:tetratricopeptide (TPR) repeat protein
MASYLARKQDILDELKPDAVLSKDPMYGNLLMDDGYYYLTVTKDYEKAEKRLSEAVLYNPDSQFILDLLSEAQTKLSIANNESSKGWSDERIEKEGLHLLRKVRDYPMARTFFESVRKDHPQNPIFALYLMEACFVLEDYPAAFEQAIFLVEQNYPNERKALRIAINCALEAQNYSEAMKYSELYLQSHPEDKTINTIYARINNGDRVEELVEIFRLK